jgi:hypothetical protein
MQLTRQIILLGLIFLLLCPSIRTNSFPFPIVNVNLIEEKIIDGEETEHSFNASINQEL